MIQLDTPYCLGRALMLGALLAGEFSIACRKRRDFQANLLRGLGFSLLLAGEAFLMLSVLLRRAEAPWVAGAVLMGAFVGAAGLRTLVFGNHYGLLRREPVALRRRGRAAAAQVVGLVALGLALSFLAASRAGSGSPVSPTGSWGDLGWWAFVAWSIQASVALALAASIARSACGTLARRESYAFCAMCLLYAAGVLGRMALGVREHWTTLALAGMAFIFFRHSYMEMNIATVRAAEDRAERILKFHRITARLKKSFDPRQICRILVDGLVASLEAEAGGVFLFDDEGRQSLRPVAVMGPLPPPVPVEAPPDAPKESRRALRDKRVPLGEGVVGEVARTGRSFYEAELTDPDPAGPARATHSAVTMPLQAGEEILGAAQISNRLDGAPLTDEDVRFMSLVVEHGALALANARLREQELKNHLALEQIHMAKRIQARLLPAVLPQFPELHSHAVCRPALEVSGDYYDLYRLDDRRAGLVVADVSGKGAAAALLMTDARAMLKTLAPQCRSPREALIRLNTAIADDIRRGMFITVLYAILDLDTGALALACAGHEPALVCRGGECRFHRPKGPAIGLLPPARFETLLRQETIQLSPRDVLLMFTDGVVEAMSPTDAPFGLDQLVETVRAHTRERPPELARDLIEAIDHHAAETPQYDDITVLVARYLGPRAAAERRKAEDRPTGAGADRRGPAGH